MDWLENNNSINKYRGFHCTNGRNTRLHETCYGSLRKLVDFRIIETKFIDLFCTGDIKKTICWNLYMRQ